jgi:hypothetical protein
MPPSPYSTGSLYTRMAEDLHLAGILLIAQVVILVGLREPALFWQLGLALGIGCALLGILYGGAHWPAQKYWLPRKTELETIFAALTR